MAQPFVPAWLSTVLTSWAQPDPWTYSFVGGWQPFAPHWLNPSITAVYLPTVNPNRLLVSPQQRVRILSSPQ